MIFSNLFPYATQYLDFEEADNYIRVQYEETAANIVRRFGRNIRKLKMENVQMSGFIDHRSTRDIYKLLQEHCADTLNQFHFDWMKEDFFEHVSKPFKNVHIVSLDKEVVGLENDRLNQVFPSMRSLYLNHVQNQNISTLASKYPNLEHLQAVYNVNQYHLGYVTETVITEIIRLNPQIKSIDLSNVNGILLQFISNHLKNLEKLTIYNYDDENQIPIYFKYVKIFKIGQCKTQSMPAHITFDEHLEDFEVGAHPRDRKYIDFILNNKNLKKICITAGSPYYGLESVDIQRLASANLDVVEMSMMYGMDASVEDFVTLIENCKHLNRLHINMYSMFSHMNDIVQMLRQQLTPNEWIVNTNEYGILIVRNNRNF